MSQNAKIAFNFLTDFSVANGYLSRVPKIIIADEIVINDKNHLAQDGIFDFLFH